MFLSFFSSSWCQGLAVVCDCGIPWTFLLTFFYYVYKNDNPSFYFHYDGSASYSSTEFFKSEKAFAFNFITMALFHSIPLNSEM